MKVYALWHGGSSYSYGTEYEIFSNVKEAKEELLRRHSNWYGSTPCCDQSEMRLFYSNPCDCPDPYPDRIIYIAGSDSKFVRTERC